MTPREGSDAAALALPRASATMPSPLERLRAQGRARRTLAMLGPAFVAAVAYVDPGNFATNVQGGARFGYLLLWVVLAANLMAMLIQYLSAKLGIVTGRNLPELCRERYSRPVVWGLWVQAELMAMSTDLAELIGAALGLNLVFGVPLGAAAPMAGVIAFAILTLQSRGYRSFEAAITGLLGLILLGFLYETLKIGPDAGGVLRGFAPHFAGSDSVLIAVGIVGATVMPHAIYLHSALTQRRIETRDDDERRELLRYQRLDIVVALGLAGLINLAMLAVAAKLFHHSGLTAVDTIQGAHAGFAHLVGSGAALAFAVALLASGASASTVGTYAGQVVMSGFIRVRVPVAVRRAVTMLPAIALVVAGLDATRALVISQTVLSFGIPFALVPLVLLSRDRRLMGAHANGRLTTALAAAVAIVIAAMNAFLLIRTFGG